MVKNIDPIYSPLTICLLPLLLLPCIECCRSVEQFDLHERVYAGKSSRVYTATDRHTGTPIALKLYRKNKLNALATCQVSREVRLHLQLSHPNIIQIYGAFEDEKNQYLVQVGHHHVHSNMCEWGPCLGISR